MFQRDWLYFASLLNTTIGRLRLLPEGLTGLQRFLVNAGTQYARTSPRPLPLNRPRRRLLFMTSTKGRRGFLTRLLGLGAIPLAAKVPAAVPAASFLARRVEKPAQALPKDWDLLVCGELQYGDDLSLLEIDGEPGPYNELDAVDPDNLWLCGGIGAPCG
jgi:hypothetical protein